MTSMLVTPYVNPALVAVGALRRALAAPGDLTSDDLGRLTRLLAATAADPLRRTARHDPAARWYLRLALTDRVEVWLLTWTPGQGTRPHDHGGASGAYTVMAGELTETWRDGPDSLGPPGAGGDSAGLLGQHDHGPASRRRDLDVAEVDAGVEHGGDVGVPKHVRVDRRHPRSLVLHMPSVV
jgi:hypothetical protein